MRRLLAPLALALLLALAGCNVSTEDGRTGENVSVTVTNQAETRYDVRVTLATEPFDAVEITYQNGSTRRLDVTSLDGVPPGRFDDATDFTVEAGFVQTRRYTLTPGSGTGATYTDVPPNTTVVHFLRPRGADTIGTVGISKCGGSPGLTELTIDILPNRTYSVTNACRGA
jgi:hypothetical protein